MIYLPGAYGKYTSTLFYITNVKDGLHYWVSKFTYVQKSTESKVNKLISSIFIEEETK